MFTLFLLSSFCASQWEIQTSGVGVTLRDVCFVDSLYGWAVGDSGIIINTIDRGNTWVKNADLTDSIEFKQVEFLNRETGFIGGNIIQKYSTYENRKAIFLRSINGGLSWERCDSMFGVNFQFAGFTFLDANNGWIGINNIGASDWTNRKGILLKTTDGGKSWSIQQEKEMLLIGAIDFWNSSMGYSFWSLSIDNYDNTEIYSTQNGGLEWSSIGIIKEEVVKKAKYYSPNTIWSIGYGASRSNDSGQSWDTWNWFSSVSTDEKRFLPLDFYTFNSNKVWLLGVAWNSASNIEGIILSTSNSGETWSTELQLPGYALCAISTVSEERICIVGTKGLIMHYNNYSSVSNNEQKNPNSLQVEQNYPNPLSNNFGRSLTTIRFSLGLPQHVNITIYDMLGHTIKVLMSRSINTDTHIVTWDGTNVDGNRVSSGVYFYIVKTELSIIKKKMLVVF
jgi:photosystem II stability/assembly factor-like uncharacterized protein